MDSNSLFELYSEVQKNYHSLLPKKEEGLVVFALYQKIKLSMLEKVFSHDNIIQAIEQVNHDLGKNTKNESPARNNEIIHNLLKFFLRRNSKGYTLREYANDFCKLIENQLFDRFNPSQVEIQFRQFYDSLLNAIKSEDEFSVWYLSTFGQNGYQIKRQLEVLHNEVEMAIKHLNTLYNSSNLDLTSKLREMDLRVKQLSIDTKKLEAAFELSDTILALINDAYHDTQSFASDSELFRDIRKEIRFFLGDIEKRLTEISFTVDKIKPQLERLYGSFDQLELNRKLEKFVDFLFENTNVNRARHTGDDVQLPDFIPLHSFARIRIRFQYPISYNFLAPTNVTLRDTSFDEPSHQMQFVMTQHKISINQKAQAYCLEALKKISIDEKFSYGQFLFSLIDKGESLELCLKTTHLLINSVERNRSIKMNVEPIFERSITNQNTALWRTTFQNLNS